MAWQAPKKGCLETRYEVTLNHEGEQVGKKPQETDGKDIKGRAESATQRQFRNWLVILTTLLALSKLR